MGKESEIPFNESRRRFLIGVGITLVGLTVNPLNTLEALAATTPEKYKSGEVVYHGDYKNSNIYLTIDDWYQRDCIEASLDLAKKEKIHFTYFPIGKVVARNKDLILRAAREGHEIGNHTWDHNRMDLGHLPVAKDGWEMDLQRNAIAKILGSSFKQHFFRPPGGYGINGGAKNPNILTQAEHRKMKVAMWGPDSRGWAYGASRHDAEAVNYVLRNVLPGLRGGAIVLQHAIADDIASLPTIIHTAKKRGLKMITMSEGIQTL